MVSLKKVLAYTVGAATSVGAIGNSYLASLPQPEIVNVYIAVVKLDYTIVDTEEVGVGVIERDDQLVTHVELASPKLFLSQVEDTQLRLPLDKKQSSLESIACNEFKQNNDFGSVTITDIDGQAIYLKPRSREFYQAMGFCRTMAKKAKQKLLDAEKYNPGSLLV